MKAGMIGLGAMGVGMARNAAKAGYLTAVYNRTTTKAQQLADELQITAYSDPALLAAAVDVILICVSADRDVLDMVKSVASGAKPGSIVIDMSTVSKETAQQAAALLAVKHIALVSRLRELPPQPLAERYVNLSIHTAPIRQTLPSFLLANERTSSDIVQLCSQETVMLWFCANEGF